MSDKTVTTDILDALRDPRHAGHLNQAAANEIERLRKKIDEMEESAEWASFHAERNARND